MKAYFHKLIVVTSKNKMNNFIKHRLRPLNVRDNKDTDLRSDNEQNHSNKYYFSRFYFHF